MRKKFIGMVMTCTILIHPSMAIASEGISSIQKVDKGAIVAPQMITGDEFNLRVQSRKYTKNGKEETMVAAPLSIDGRLFIPVRFVVDELIQGQFTWEKEQERLTIVAGEVTLQMTIGSRHGSLNGETMIYEAAPILREGTTYVPLVVVRDYLDITLTYNSESQRILLKTPDKGLNYPPIADFRWGEETYSAGQLVTATNTSYDPDGHKLLDKEWCVISETGVVTNKELNAIFRYPTAGEYTIGLRVQDQYQLWSEWVYKDLTIWPNEAPIITSLTTDQSSYAQGEMIAYDYTYMNESWEQITNEKWTYRHAEEATNKAILGKPDALFTAGEYIISLEIDDAFGNRSALYETAITITDEVVKKELEYRFTEGKVGDIIDNYQGFNYREYADAPITSSWLTPGTLLMSDSPEEVYKEGILYRDSINGEGRLLFHHINRFSDTSIATGNKRLVVVAENTSDEPVAFTLSNQSIKGPTTDITLLGQRVLYDYLMGSEAETIVLEPGERRYVYDSKTRWLQDTCISGIVDVETKGDVTFTFAAVSAGNTIYNMSDMELFLQAVHPRGTFEGLALNYRLTLENGQPTKLILGSGADEWVKGYDALTKDEAQNKGNYGVTYSITITATEDMGIILNPRANIFRGAIKWDGVGVYNTPSDGGIFSNTAKAISLGTIKKGETKTLEYMLPNGSAAPVLLGFIPSSYWND